MQLDPILFGPLQALLQDESISEIMVNNHATIFVEKKGQIHSTSAKFESESSLLALIHAIAESCGREIKASRPFMDAYLPDGSRVNATLPPMATKGANLTIRKFRRQGYSLTDFIQLGTLTHKAAYFLHACVQARINIIVSGGTGSGKTSFLNTLASLVNENERIISIEDIAELQLQHPNWVRLESVYLHGQAPITTKDCLVNALRMRPDRILVGECRKDETFEMLQAMNTGHDGSMTTIHANSTRDCLSRMESLIATSNVDLPISALRKQIASAVHLIVQLKRTRTGQRQVVEILELTGVEQSTITSQPLLSRDKTKIIGGTNLPDGELASTGLVPNFMDRFADFGIQFPPNFFDPRTAIQYRPE